MTLYKRDHVYEELVINGNHNDEFRNKCVLRIHISFSYKKRTNLLQFVVYNQHLHWKSNI